ncbi:MAG: urease accessory protein UreE [Lachnospiraceae bacterium]|nr:urease accessory protein UreE [Lachnospiraceae bacterium]
MICTEILGKISDFDVHDRKVEKVAIDWEDASTKVQRKMTDAGREIGLRMDDTVLVRGMYEGDVIYADDELVIVVTTPPCDVIKVRVAEDHPMQVAKVAYEIGNRHAPLFYGDDLFSFVTPYNEPMLTMLEKIHGVTAEKAVMKLDFEKRISTTVHHHTH